MSSLANCEITISKSSPYHLFVQYISITIFNVNALIFTVDIDGRCTLPTVCSLHLSTKLKPCDLLTTQRKGEFAKQIFEKINTFVFLKNRFHTSEYTQNIQSKRNMSSCVDLVRSIIEAVKSIWPDSNCIILCFKSSSFFNVSYFAMVWFRNWLRSRHR